MTYICVHNNITKSEFILFIQNFWTKPMWVSKAAP